MYRQRTLSMTRRAVLFAGLAMIVAASLYLTLLHHRSRSVVVIKPATAPVPVAAASMPVPKPPVQAASAAPVTNAVVSAAAPKTGREFDLAVNPYASALREPGKSKRAWDPDFLKNLPNPKEGDPIRFELTNGKMASGTMKIMQYRDGELTYLSGELTEPETGKFFFITPPAGGKAGKSAGVVEFPASQTAYRIEPTGANGEPELWQRQMGEVLCQAMPLANDTTSTNEPENIPPLRPDLVQNYVPSYNSNVVSLQSYPGSKAVLLLDFFGGYTPTWGGIAYPKPAVSNAQIKDLWKRVAEDYMAFNINVTTDIQVYQNAPANSRQKCVFTPTTSALGPGAAGVSYEGSWNWGSDTVCWSQYTSGKNGAEVGAHEPGHTLGLSHEGTDINGVHNEYFSGQGSGATGWAPIMGAGYYQNVTTFSKGDYANPSNLEDQLNVIATVNNNVTYRLDDTGNTLATSRYLEVYPDFSVAGEGVIERSADTDAFQFTTTGGQVFLRAMPVGDWADLAVSVTLADATDTVIASNNPQNVLYGTINMAVAAGTYTFRVTGAGRNDPLTNGFSSYPSLGYYSIVGSVAGARLPTRLSVMEHATNNTVVGTVPASNTNDTLAYTVLSGNTSNAFSIDATGVVRVANSVTLDYARLVSSNSYAVQYELFVNITDATNPGLTETNRRVVIGVQSATANYPIAVTGFNAGVIVPYTATTANKGATGFDIANNDSFYQAGLNGNAQVTGSGGNQGLPQNGVIVSQFDNTTFQLGPYGGNNALMMGYTYPNSGTLTLTTPQAYNSIAILASSANGGGAGTFVLHFTNGATSQTFNFNAQDWYNNTANVAALGFGRLLLGGGLQTEDAGTANPNLYQTTIDLTALGLNQAISSITFTKPTATGNQDSGVFALSGVAMPPQVVIAQQPVSVTNVTGGSSSTFSVVAMGNPSLAFQWYNGNPGSGTILAGQTNASLIVTPTAVNQVSNYYAVVTNSISSATSAVATLTVYRSPVITQQPGPNNLTLLAGGSTSFTVGANAALPLSYFWKRNGTFVPGGTSLTLALNNLQVSDTGNYTVTVSNSFGNVTSIAASLTVLAAPTYPVGQSVLADHPIGYWRLDETGGTVAHDYVGGKNGTYTSVVLGQAGNGLIDTHTAAGFGPGINSYVAGIPIDFATATNATFSVEAWVKGNAQTTDAGVVTKGTGSGGEQFNLDTGGGGHAFRFFVRDSGGGAHLANGTVGPNGSWHHVVGVCDELNGVVVLYVDGISNAFSSITVGSGILSSANAMTIGSRQAAATGAYNNQFIGSLEEVAVYNYALTPAQVQTHFSGATNRAPVFAVNPFTGASVVAGQAYSGTVATNASDPNGNAIIFAKVSGPTWLGVAGNGALSGTPVTANVGMNSFVVSASDAGGLSNSATFNVMVTAAPALVSAIATQGTNLSLTWSGGVGPYQVQTTTNLGSSSWQNFGPSANYFNLTIAPTNGALFYRVQGH